MVRQGKAKSIQPARRSPTASISSIGSLKKYPDKDYSLELLHEVAKLTAPLMHERGFKVGTLCEMFPKSANLLGLNVNKGQKILLRLRYHSNSRSFLPLGDILGTFLHELTHNIYGAHDKRFYDYLDGLKTRYEEIQYGGAGVKGYFCEETKLGGSNGGLNGGGYTSIRDKQLKVVTKPKFKCESRKLGGLSTTKINLNNKSVRELMLRAAQRRAQDEKLCGENVKLEKLKELDDNELTLRKIDPNYKEVIDLTMDEYGEGPVEVIEIDACEKDPKSILKHSKTSKKSKNNQSRRSVSFQLLPSFEKSKPIEQEVEIPDPNEIHYVTSTSPRTFIQDNAMYPRRKMVADLNFNQIMNFDSNNYILPYQEITEEYISSEKDNIISIPIQRCNTENQGDANIQVEEPIMKKDDSTKKLSSSKSEVQIECKNQKSKIRKGSQSKKEQRTPRVNGKTRKVVKSIDFHDLL